MGHKTQPLHNLLSFRQQNTRPHVHSTRELLTSLHNFSHIRVYKFYLNTSCLLTRPSADFGLHTPHRPPNHPSHSAPSPPPPLSARARSVRGRCRRRTERARRRRRLAACRRRTSDRLPAPVTGSVRSARARLGHRSRHSDRPEMSRDGPSTDAGQRQTRTRDRARISLGPAAGRRWPQADVRTAPAVERAVCGLVCFSSGSNEHTEMSGE